MPYEPQNSAKFRICNFSWHPYLIWERSFLHQVVDDENQFFKRLRFFSIYFQNGVTYGIIEHGMWIFRLFFAVSLLSFCQLLGLLALLGHFGLLGILGLLGLLVLLGLLALLGLLGLLGTLASWASWAIWTLGPFRLLVPLRPFRPLGFVASS